MGNTLSNASDFTYDANNANNDTNDTPNQQRSISREEYMRYQAYQKEKERQYLQEQQQSLHSNAISNQQNTYNNIGSNNTLQSNVPMRHQIPDHVPTQFINRPQPSNTNVNTIMDNSYEQTPQDTQINNRLYRENITRNYDRPLIPKVQSNKPTIINSAPSSVNQTYGSMQQSQQSQQSHKNNLLGKIKEINNQNQSQSQTQSRSQAHTQPQKKVAKSIQINKEVLEKIDPFQLLAKEKLSIPELKNKYKKLSLIHHPDRGGSIDNFNLLNRAIKNIDTLIKFHSQKQTHSSLKNNFKQDIDSMQKTTNVNIGKKFSVDKFNSVYESNKIRTRDDDGYGSLMGKRTDEREDIEIKRLSSGKVTKDSFNNHFNQYKEKIMGDIEVHADALPEPSTLDRELMYKELGDSKSNFSNMREGYTDFKQAHIDNTLINTNVKYNKYKSVEDLEHARSNNVTLTEQDHKLIGHQKEQEKQRELYRKQTLEENDRLMYEKFKRSNQMLLGHN